MEKLKVLYSMIYVLVQELILNPRGFWRAHTETRESQEELFKNLLIPLIVVVCTAVFFGEFFRSDYFRIWVAALWALREIVLFASLYFVGVYVTNEIIKAFGFESKLENL